MNKKLRKLISSFIIVATIVNVIPVSVFATEVNPVEKRVTYNQNMNSEYVQELQDMGLSIDEINRLHEINVQMANADSSFEVDRLMVEYHEIIDKTPLAVAKSISAPNGGTMDLDYTGDMSAISNVIYTKVIYMPAEQVVFYQRGMNDVGFIDWITSYVSDEGLSVITATAAKEIAAALGVSTSSVSWLVGLAAGGVVYVLSNLETFDINDAIDRSTTGKLKLEYYYSTSISFPYYMEHENFEPWNNSSADVPADYDYTWNAGEFNYNR